MGKIIYSNNWEGQGIYPISCEQPKVIYPFEEYGIKSAAILELTGVWKNPNFIGYFNRNTLLSAYPQLLERWREFSNEVDPGYFSQFENFLLCEVVTPNPVGAGQYQATLRFANIPTAFNYFDVIDFDEPQWKEEVPLSTGEVRKNGGGGRVNTYSCRYNVKFVHNPSQGLITTDQPFVVINYDPPEPVTDYYVNQNTPEGIISEYYNTATTQDRKNQILSQYSAFRARVNWLAVASLKESKVVDEKSNPDVKTYINNYLNGSTEIIPQKPDVQRYCGDIFQIITPYIKLTKSDQNQGNVIDLSAGSFWRNSLYVNYGLPNFVSYVNTNFEKRTLNNGNVDIDLVKYQYNYAGRPGFVREYKPAEENASVNEAFDTGITIVMVQRPDSSVGNQFHFIIGTNADDSQRLRLQTSSFVTNLYLNAVVIPGALPPYSLINHVYILKLDNQTHTAQMIVCGDNTNYEMVMGTPFTFNLDKSNFGIYTAYNTNYDNQELFETIVIPKIVTDDELSVMQSEIKTNFTLRGLFIGYK